MKHKRSITGIILIIFLINIFVYYYIDHNNHDPDIHYILTHFQKFKNTEILFSAEIIKSCKLKIMLNSIDYRFLLLKKDEYIS